jgi:hypothetical protein
MQSAEKEMFEMQLKEVEHVVNPIMISHSSPLTLVGGVDDDNGPTIAEIDR